MGGGATHSVDFAYFLAYDTSVLDSTSTLDFALSFLYFLYRFLFCSLFHTRESSLESTFSYNAPTPSLRALRGKAWQSIKSTINPRIHFYKKSTSALFSTFFSPFLWLFGIAPRPSIHPLLFAHSSNNPNIHTPFTAAKLMDCHAAASTAARNDRNNAAFQSIASLEKVDSRSKAQPTHHDSKHYGVALHSIPKPKHHRRQDF